MRTDSQSFVKRRDLFALTMVVAATLLVASSEYSSAVEGKLSLIKTIGPWSLFCADRIKSSDDCALAQATLDGKLNRSLRVAFAFKSDGNVRMRIVTGPIYGEYKRISLLLDGRQTGFVDASACSESDCTAVLTLLHPYIYEMQKAKELGFETLTSERHGFLATLSAAAIETAFTEMHAQVTSHVQLGPDDYWAKAIAGETIPRFYTLDLIPRNYDIVGPFSFDNQQLRVDASHISKTCGESVSDVELPILVSANVPLPAAYETTHVTSISKIARVLNDCEDKLKLSVSGKKEASEDQNIRFEQGLKYNGIRPDSIFRSDSKGLNIRMPQIER